MIDLHIHTRASDGTTAPSEVIRMARDMGLRAISIADHDTIDGVVQALEAGIPDDLGFITGIEISADPPAPLSSKQSIHILGYGFSVNDTCLNTALERLQQARRERNPKILKKLEEIGISISMATVERLCGKGQPGRPHIAAAMVEQGVVASFDEAFQHYLAGGCPAHVEKFRYACSEAISLITRAGGVAVLAHPGLLELPADYPMGEFVDDLIRMGLAGIEVYHTDHNPEQVRYFEKISLNRDLLMTGGSDFHGTVKPEVRMGTGTGELSVPDHLFPALTRQVELLQKQPADLENLEANLNHCFQDRHLLETALRHSSYVNELASESLEDNQRLEFLGDAVLGLAVGEMLMQTFPDMREGELSKLRSSLVSEEGLAFMARRIDLGRFVYLGRGEQMTGGADKNSILADTFEAVIAAVYRDRGFDAAADMIRRHFKDQISPANPPVPGCRPIDHKSHLQERVQECGAPPPEYHVIAEEGPAHDKIFHVRLNAGDIDTTGTGKSKKAAEQDAAARALLKLDPDSCQAP